jgi:hypothetical protein
LSGDTAFRTVIVCLSPAANLIGRGLNMFY